MKLQIHWLIGILGVSTLISFPVVAQTNPLDNFFNGIPPYDGESINYPLNPVQKRDTSEDRERQDSAETSRTRTEQNRSRNQSERERQLETTPMKREQNGNN